MKNKILLLIVILLGITSSLQAQKISTVRQHDKKIVVEYDLDTDADFVSLYVSLDGGKSYKGPLKFVEGDIENVVAGYNRSIVWDVLKEFKELKGDNVKFKIVVQNKEKYPRETFFMANAGYSSVFSLSYGLTFGQVKRWGWFLSLATNGNLQGFSTDMECDERGLVNGHLPMYSGVEATTRVSAMVGCMVKLAEPLSLKFGAGFGSDVLCWETKSGKWVKNSSFGATGVDVKVGLQAHFGGVAISLEAVSTSFKTIEAKLGIGFFVKKKNKNLNLE